MNQKKVRKKWVFIIIAISIFLLYLPVRSVHAESTGFSNIHVGSDGITGSSAANQFQGRLATATIGNDLYAAWVDMQTSPFRLRVQKYNGTTKAWSFIDGTNSYKNRVSSSSADDPWLYAYNSKLYLTWVENGCICVEQYNPTNSTWTAIDNGGVIKSGSGGSLGTPSMCLYNGKLNVAFTQGNTSGVPQVRVARYDGDFSSNNTWTFIDQGSNNGLNYNTSRNVTAPRMAVYGSDLLVAWTEYNANNIYQMRVKRLTGTTWSSADGGAVDTGINFDTSKSAYYYCTIANYKGDVYLSWYEEGKNSTYASGIVTKKYSGSGWNTVDGGTSPKADPNSVYSQNNPSLCTDGNNLYLTYCENNDIRVKKFDGNIWTFADGNHSIGIKSDSLSSSYRGQIQLMNGIPYIVWEGSDSVSKNIKVYVARYMPCILSTEATLIEKNLDSQSFTVTLENDTFKDEILDKANFEILNAPPGLSIENVNYINNTTCKIDLAFTGNISSNQKIGLKILVNELNYGKDICNLDDLTVNYSRDSAFIKPVINIQKSNNSDLDISLSLNGNAFTSISELNLADYVVKNESTITLKAAYLATLPIGKTKVTFNFDYGNSAVLEIYVNNLAYGKTILEKSSEYPNGYEATLAVDGDKVTCWSQNADSASTAGNGLPCPQYIVVDLGADYVISSWAIVTDDSAGCQAATVYGKSSETGASFEEIGSFTGNSDLYKNNSITTSKNYRYIKLQVNSANAYNMGYTDINEFEVYGFKTYIVSGNAGIAGATLSYADGSDKTATADANGDYTFTVSDSWAGTVTPTKVGYRFTPVNRSYSSVTSDQTGQNYTVTMSIAASITTNPANQTVTAGQTATFTVVASGDATISYQWKKDGNNITDGGNISGATTATLTIANVQAGAAGSYTCYVSNESGNATSTGATLTVNPAPVVAAPAPTPEPTPAPTTIRANVVDAKTGQEVNAVTAQVTTEKDGTKTVEVKSQEAVVVLQADGTKSALTEVTKIAFTAPTLVTSGTTEASQPSVSVAISADGTISVKGLANNTETKFDVTYDLGNGNYIKIGTMDVKVSANGDVNLTSTLIDPYGIITDAATGKIIDGADVILYYANTDRNKTTGKIADTVVQLPGIEGFKPNNNKNPQISDLTGAYGFMVFPTSDYYIVATKKGYNKYTSPTISVEYQIVKWDFKMNQTNLAKPVISLKGNSEVTINMKDIYVDAGASAVDSNGVDLTKQITTTGAVDVQKAGDYAITYTVTDSSGNEAQKVTRTVHVINTTKPVIAIKGDAEVSVKLNESYNDLGAAATDNKNDDISGEIKVVNPVNIAEAGDYTITYDVTDAFGNKALQVTRIVHVIDTTKPVIVVKGAKEIKIKLKVKYTDLGATATDNKGNDISDKIKISNNVNTLKIGSYKVTYYVTDTFGNKSDLYTRKVYVTAPVKKPIPKVKPAKAVISVSVNKPLIFTNSIDNIAGSVFAAMNNGRVIILSKSKIDVEQVKRYLISNKKQISKIYILGGTKAINTKLEKLMKSISIKYVIRIGGADKYETAALLAGLMKLDKGTPVILTADGTKSEILDKIVKANAKTKYPILLTNKNNINSYAKKTIDDIKPKKIYIVGDENVISKAQIDDIIKSFKLKASDIVWIKVSNDVKKIK